MRKFLLPLSLLYWLGVIIRNLFFDKGIIRIKKVNVSVISIGNISAGGTGKTPIVEMLITKLAENLRVAVVSRGYKRKSSGSLIASDGKGKIASVEKIGDEPSQLAQKYPEIIIIVDENKTRGVQKAIELSAEVVLLDDGFQHRYLHRDLDIVVVTASELLKGDFLLPAGNRREPIASLKRANFIMITKCSDKEMFYMAVKKVEVFNKPTIGLRTKLSGFKRIYTGENEEISNKKILAVSGIGNPKSFEELLLSSGLFVEKHIVFKDHHWFTKKDIEHISKINKQINAECIITTEKDAVRLKDKFQDFLASENFFEAIIEQEILIGKDVLDDLLERVIHENRNN